MRFRKGRKFLSLLIAVSMLLGTMYTSEITSKAAGLTSNVDGLEIVDGVLVRYTGTATEVVIPDGVTRIEYEAFRNCTSLTSVNIPNSVKSIEELAFSGCTSLTSITVPNSVTSMGYYVFSDCKSLTSITIPNSVTSIGEYAFAGCISLTSITIPNSVKSIGACAFVSCTSLTSITIPNSVTSIGVEAFAICTSLESITIPSSVTSIKEYAFSGCTNLTITCVKDSYVHKYAVENDIPVTFYDDGQTKTDISQCMATLETSSYTYDGTEKKPSVTVKNGNTTLKNGTDYSVSYKDNTNAGTASVIIIGLGNYTGGITKTFTIQKASPSITYTKTYNKTFGDKAFTLNAKITKGDGKLFYNSSDNKVAMVNGSGKVTIKGTGIAVITVTASATQNYQATTMKVTINVAPKKVKINSVKPVKGKKLKVSWKKDVNVSKYQIQYSTDKNFKKGVCSVTVNKSNTTSKTLTKLTKGKRYHVRIRGYKGRLYGKWGSAIKSGKIK